MCTNHQKGIATMAKLSTDSLIESFKEMTLIELSEFVKLFEDTFGVTAAAPVAVAAAGRGNGNGGRRSDTEGVLEQLHELRELDQRHFLERLDELCGAELCHGGSSFLVIRTHAVSGDGDGSSSATGSRQLSSPPVATSLVVSASTSTVTAGASTPSWATGASCGAVSMDSVGASATPAAGASASILARRASTTRAVCDKGAAKRYTALLSDANMAPASLARRTSRDSRSASLEISAGDKALPSRRPALITRWGFALAKSRRPLVASTGSPVMKAIADGPES